jgi:hypothetical protein
MFPMSSSGAGDTRQKLAVPIAATLDVALAIVRPFLDPVLDGTAAGAWNPERRVWDP